MNNKYLFIAILLCVTIASYLVVLVVMPFLSSMASTANITMAANSNLSNYPGASEGIMAAPLVLMFVPGAICVIVVIWILRRR